MKNLSVFFLSLSLFALSGCGKDSPEEELAGTWKASKLLTTNCSDANANQNLTFSNGCYFDQQIGIELCMTITLNANKTYSTVTSSKVAEIVDTETETGTYTVSGNTLTFCPAGGECTKGVYTLDGNSLTLTTKAAKSQCTTVMSMSKERIDQ